MNTIYFLPNVFTTANLFFGFYSVVSSLNGDYVRAAAVIIIACLFDLLDGRVARATHSYSQFGAEYDSLADGISFGMAPSLLVYLSMLKVFGRIGWLAAFLFLACGVLRLARFNVQSKSIEKSYFQGLPIPMAAATLAGAMLLIEEAALRGVQPHFTEYLTLLMTLVLALLMVSDVKYKSFKEIDLKEKRSFGVLVIALFLLIIVALKPEIMIFTLAGTYVVVGLTGWVISSLRKKPSQKPESLPVDQKRLIFFPKRKREKRSKWRS
ncbi:MAG: CDP-diacylglycerol--serine O-phosphatidyltransferase [Deltaproteobacteria bacterium]|nr:CDP-diacylglycerol--serine O-phosphatidyltransferase [Deltaproteobacteria bacterium]